MAEPPELPPRTKTQTSDKSLPRPPEVADANDVDIVIDAPTPTNGDTSILFNHDEFHSTLLEDRDVYRPLPTVPSKGELAEKSEKLRKYSDSPRQSALMVGMNSTFAKEVAESIAMPTDSIIPEHWVSSTANKRKSNDGVSTKSGNSVKLNSTPAETKKLEDGHSAEDPNKETNIAEVSPNKRNSTSKSITESNKSKSPEPQPVLDRRQTTSPSNTQVKILDAQNNTASTNNSSIPSVENPSVNSNIVPAPAAININTAPVPIYAGGIFLGYGKSNTPTRPAMVPHNQQLYARPRPGAMYARPATENIPLGLQYRPGDVRPRPAFRPGFRPRPNMIVRPGMEHYRPDFRPGPGMEGYRPAYRPYPAMDPNYRPHPSMDPKFRPRPNMDPNFRSAPSGMYSRPFPGRPYPDASRSQYGGSQVGFGGSDVGYQGGSEVGYQGGPGLVRRTSYMDGAQANHQPGPLRKTSMMEHNHRTGSPSLRKTSQMDIDVEGISRQNSEIVVSPLQRRNTDSQSPFSASESGYRQSVPVYNAESGLYSVPKPFDPSRPLYRGPPTSPNAIYGQSIRPPAQRAASYHYPQGYYRPSQSASFHSSDSNSVISTSFRPRPSGIVSELGLRTSPEPDLDSPVMEPGSPGKRKMSINSDAEANPPSPGKKQLLDSPDSPTKKLAFGEMNLDPPVATAGNSVLPIPDAGGGYRNNSLNFTAPKAERRRSFEKIPNEGLLFVGNEGPALSRRSSLDDGTLTRKGKKVQVEESDMDSDVASSVAASAVDSTVHSDMRPTFVTISRPRRDAGSKWIDPVDLLNEQRIECNASRDPKVHFEFAKACLANGEPYLDEGFAILRRLASSGYPEAHFFLGEAFTDDGKDSLAYAQYLSAAKRGYAPACFAIGKCAEEGKGCKKNTRLALEMYSKAATAGNLQAMYRLGKAELEGTLGMKKDPVKATKWFKRAAAVPNREHPEPLYELAVIYESGVPPYILQDFAYARGVLQEAADFGYPAAIYKLGYCYEHGLMGYDVNPAESIRLYSEALNLGFTEALLGMAGWHMTGADTLLPQNQDMAFQLVKEAADRQLARAQYTLGYFYEGGIGTYINMDLAFKYYELAASQGEERAIARIQKANPNSKISTKKDKKKSFFGGLFGKK